MANSVVKDSACIPTCLQFSTHSLECDWTRLLRFDRVSETGVVNGIIFLMELSLSKPSHVFKIRLIRMPFHAVCVFQGWVLNKNSENVMKFTRNYNAFSHDSDGNVEISLDNAGRYVVDNKIKIYLKLEFVTDNSRHYCSQKTDEPLAVEDCYNLLQPSKGDDTLPQEREQTFKEKACENCSKLNNQPYPVGLMKDLGRLLEEESGDVSLCVGDNTVKVHKTIVMARSPLLAAILDDQQQHHFQDLDLDVVQTLVRYMYTDHIEDIEKYARKLYPLACKFAFLALKEQCEDAIVKSLTVENAVETLILADVLSKDLKDRVIDFIKSKFMEVKATTGFKSMFSTNLHLYVELSCVLLGVDATVGAHKAA